MQSKYLGNFSNIEDVRKEFSINIGDIADSEIIIAAYETGSYEGYAYVLFKRNDKLYEVLASHCSCYGLEGKWKPEETSVKGY